MPGKWKPVEDLPSNWPELTDSELTPLLEYWQAQRDLLKAAGRLAETEERLRREWAIEAGHLDGLWAFDPETVRTLVERGIDAKYIPSASVRHRPEAVAAMIQDHAGALDNLAASGAPSAQALHDLHAGLLRRHDSELPRGRYRDRESGEDTCPPDRLAEEIERLLELHRRHDAAGVPVEVQAAWLHHGLEHTQPYEHGSRRVANAVASLPFLKAGWFPVVMKPEDRLRHVESLDQAAAGDLRPLVDLLVDAQKRSLFRAVGGSESGPAPASVEDALAGLKQELLRPEKPATPPTWDKAKETADLLMGLAEARLEAVAADLQASVGKARPEFRFALSTKEVAPAPLTESQLDYRPGSGYRRYAELSLDTGKSAQIQVQAHAVGLAFRGLIGIVTVFWGTGPADLASESPFQVNYTESSESAERRFRPWLERSLARALESWRRSL